MTYTDDMIEMLTAALAFASDSETFEALTKGDRSKAQVLEVFNAETEILEALIDLKQLKRPRTFLELTKYLYEDRFQEQIDRIDIEANLERHLDGMIVRKLLTKKFNVTKLGKKILDAKKRAFYNETIHGKIGQGSVVH